MRELRFHKPGWLIYIFLCHLSLSARSQVTLTDSSRGIDAGIQAGLQPALLGADGPEFTQVEAAQRLGFSGRDVKICVIDQGVDVKSPNFGQCKAVADPAPPTCRIYFGYDVGSGSNNPTPWTNDNGHGTHVAGIALGSFPNKLLDQNGVPLPYQRGVAFEALLGAVKADDGGSTFPTSYLVKGLKKLVEAQCDIINMSLGLEYVEPYPEFKAIMDLVAEAGVVVIAAAGNRPEPEKGSGAKLFDVESPGSFPTAFAVANLNNTANPGSLLQLSRAIPTSTGMRDTLAAVQRADSPRSICSPTCKDLKFPMKLALYRVESNRDCSTPKRVTSGSTQGAALVLQFSPDCVEYIYSSMLWWFVQDRQPALVLLAMPSEEDTFIGVLAYSDNEEIPVMWLRTDDGLALSAALAQVQQSGGPLMLNSLPGAIMAPMPDAYARQPAITSSIGPAYDLSLKPDIAAPGSLYSSLPGETYQTWPGTSMASPYVAGVAALWMQQQRQSGSSAPPGGWINAAFRALKNTAKPVDYPNSNKAWPPAKVGAGVVQAQSALLTTVSINPPQILLRTDVPSQTVSLTLTNTGSSMVVYRLGHKPAVTVSLNKAWYGVPYDESAPTAELQSKRLTVKVPPRGSTTVQVTVVLSPALLALDDAVISGYLTLTPTKPTKVVYKPLSPSRLATPPPKKITNGTQPATGIPVFRSRNTSRIAGSWRNPGLDRSLTYVTLSVAYQGASRDYSSIGSSSSLAVFPKPNPAPNPEAAKSLDRLLSVCCCGGWSSDWFTGGECASDAKANGTITIDSLSVPKFAAPLIRPVKSVRVLVLNTTGELLGYSEHYGPCQTAVPKLIGYVPGNLCGYDWDGYFVSAQGKQVKLSRGQSYKFKLEFTPYLAAGDAAAGRKAGEPYVVDVFGTLIVKK